MGKAEELLKMAVRHPRMWVLTGAGISTESGIPDFRSPGSGLWERVDPMEVFSVDALSREPRRFFEVGLPMFEGILSAQPNAAHQVLGKMQKCGLLGPVVTQNIDGLHQKGDAFFVYEVHGHVRTATCMGCGQTVVSMDDLITRFRSEGEIPRCSSCRQVLKPDVILFGDAMPSDYMNARLLKASYSHHSLSLLVVGSSLVVAPINYFPMEFDHLAIINRDQTSLDRRAELLWPEKAGTAMAEVWSVIERETGEKDPLPLPRGFLPGAFLGELIDDSLTREGEVRELKGDKAGRVMAETLLWQEVLGDYLARNGSRNMAGLVCRSLLDDLSLLQEGCRGSAASLEWAQKEALLKQERLAKDHLAALETVAKSGPHPQAVREFLIATLAGFIGWCRSLARAWGRSGDHLDKILWRPVERGYAEKQEIEQYMFEY